MAEQLAKICELEPRCYRVAMMAHMAINAMPDTYQELMRCIAGGSDPLLAKLMTAAEIAESTPLPDPPLCKKDCPRLIGPYTG